MATNIILCSKPKINTLATTYFQKPMIQLHGKTMLSIEFNPILKAHGNYLSKPMVNLMAIISISLTYRLSFEAYIQEVKNFLNPSRTMPTFCYITIQPISIAT